MISIIKSGDVYAPDRLGKKDILTVNGKIIAIGDSFTLGDLSTEIIDVSGKKVCPGFIDQHVHVTGGGGQFGFSSFIPELNAHDLLAVGTTTVLGLLGTDGFVKELSTLYAKVKSLSETGVTAYMLTNFYGLPEKTICGSVAEDLIFIDKVIGCKLAISDDRSAFPTEHEILRLINQVRLGGFTSGKGGILHIHLGALESRIDVLLSIAGKYPSLISYISPTHCSRTRPLFNDCLKLAKLGGMIDISTGGTTFTEPHKAVQIALSEGVPLHNITFSSDGRGGVKREDPLTHEITYQPAPMDRNLKETASLVREKILPLEEALRLITVNPARNMKIRGKGEIKPGYDADFVILNDQLEIERVISSGRTRIVNN
ncbi:MAG TPA: beta-aspartyl-peptidase [Bacteroidales bacterium]|jgi:beta-aspartyl-dipeptidase (metallo-type)|nr:MAG: Isoaspartyl dipeptidase [Bacteroidetes bacterium ADurb.BinA104]HQH25731.1 beta-aspartyl-peptidase [Bacteroidales bacterium]HQJ83576.1 beta-aspartyl-peptidase [Bacteroidales bacterium]